MRWNTVKDVRDRAKDWHSIPVDAFRPGSNHSKFSNIAMAEIKNTTDSPHCAALQGRYLSPVKLDGGGWTTGLFSIDGELIDEFGFWRTRNDAVYGCTILKERLGYQVPS